jgi:hypothetical protein
LSAEQRGGTTQLDVDPKTNADMAKILIWSFVAGYSEKLVPNMVTKIFVMPEQDSGA